MYENDILSQMKENFFCDVFVNFFLDKTVLIYI